MSLYVSHIISPCIRAKRVKQDLEKSLKRRDSQKIDMPRNAYAIKRGILLTIARPMAGAALPKAASMSLYVSAFPRYRRVTNHASMQPKPSALSAVMMFKLFLNIEYVQPMIWQTFATIEITVQTSTSLNLSLIRISFQLASCFRCSLLCSMFVVFYAPTVMRLPSPIDPAFFYLL